jgi:hypothetical protein
MKLRRVSAFGLTLLLTLAAGRTAVAQQQPAGAPVPPAILSARTIFISKASGYSFVPMVTADQPYNDFYAAMKDWGRYQVVGSPTDADLIIEIRLECASGPCNWGLEATILDPKTHAILWVCAETVQYAARIKTNPKNFDKSMAALVADLKALSGSAGAASQP